MIRGGFIWTMWLNLLTSVLLWMPIVVAAQIPEKPSLKALATINIIADIANEVAGNVVFVESLLPPGTDPHVYEPTTADARKIAQADLILKNGLTLEGWLDKLIANSGTKAAVVTVTNYINPIKSSTYANAFDPHAWMNPLNGIAYADAIREALSGVLPDYKAQFQDNFENYKTRLLAVHAYIEELMLEIPADKRMLITSHDAFRYFAQQYGLQVASVLGTSTDADVSVSSINELIEIIRKNKVACVFIEKTFNPKLMQQLAADLGISVGKSLYTDSFGPKGSAADSYISMLMYNAQAIANGLTLSKTPETGPVLGVDLMFIGGVFAVFLIAFIWLVLRLRKKTYKIDAHKGLQLNVDNITVLIDNKLILTNIYLQLEHGKVYGLFGANGSGKSTLLRAILGLIPKDTGTVTVNGLPVQSVLPSIAYLPQKDKIDHSFPATVLDLVQIGLFPGLGTFSRPTAHHAKKVDEVLNLLEIADLKHRQINELSGGQFQRALIARAICQEADIFLLDEPFVGVDMASEQKIIQILKQKAAEGKIVLIVHHDLSKVHEYFDHIILLNQRLIAVGPVNEVFTEENIQKTFSGKLTLLQKAMWAGKQKFNT
jgi:ABC-type Mn2+/Zn2+ transport system ATPase subunit/ABC-type Zn uptake system ZnuABC Zn-binding protein ZnuA